MHFQTQDGGTFSSIDMPCPCYLGDLMAVMEGDWQGLSRVESLVWPFAAEEGSFRRRNRLSGETEEYTSD